MEIVDFCREKGAKNINISGGEPLLHDHLHELICHIRSLDISATIYTSGNIHDNRLLLQVIEGASNKDLHFIFNYPSADLETFQHLVASRVFNPSEIDSRISLLLSRGFDVETHIVPNALNIGNLHETISHLKTIGVKKVSLLRLVLQGRAQQNRGKLSIHLDNKKLSELFTKIADEYCDSDFSLRLGVPFRQYSSSNCECLAGTSKLIFRYDGTVFPCEAFKESPTNTDFILGNVYTDSLATIWDNCSVHRNLSLLRKASSEQLESCPAQLLHS
jgi:radical SAM protein with 4Fe4S-binding SPASM domain